jgi:hypothetical protein
MSCFRSSLLPLLFTLLHSSLNVAAQEQAPPSHGEAWQDPSSKLIFPQYFAGLFMQEIYSYEKEDARLGRSVGYRGDAKTTLTLYVYPVETQLARQSDEQVVAHYLAEATAVVQQAEQQGAYRNVKIVKPLTWSAELNGKTLPFMAISLEYEFAEANTPLISWVIVTRFENFVIKVRLTSPKTETGLGQRVRKRLEKDLMAVLGERAQRSRLQLLLKTYFAAANADGGRAAGKKVMAELDSSLFNIMRQESCDKIFAAAEDALQQDLEMAYVLGVVRGQLSDLSYMGHTLEGVESLADFLILTQQSGGKLPVEANALLEARKAHRKLDAFLDKPKPEQSFLK